jgi:hypothetical protein
MKIKILTCIYSDLHKTNMGGRSNRKEHYRYSLLALMKMSQADFTCYTSERELEDLEKFFYEDHNIPKERLTFIVFDLLESKYSPLLNSLRGGDVNSVSDRCYEIQYSKFAWFENEDKSYDYYFWFDAGLSHTGLIPDKYLTMGLGYRSYFESTLFNDKFLENLINFAGDKFVIVAKENSRNYWEGTVDPKFYENYDNSVHIIGGFFGGKKELWDKVVQKFDEYVNVILPEQKKFFYEEHYMSLMYQNNKEWFKPLEFDIWWHEDNHKQGTVEFFQENKSFYKILESLNG